MSHASCWSGLEAKAEDLIFALDRQAKEAPEPKANLTIGAYRDENGQPYPLSVVRKAEARLAEKALYNKEYLPMLGMATFSEAAAQLLYGYNGDEKNTVCAAAEKQANPVYEYLQSVNATEKGWTLRPLTKERVYAVQTLSGTGAVRLGSDFLFRTLQDAKNRHVYVSNPTWSNHFAIFRASGFETVDTYRYWKAETKGFDFEGMIADAKAAPNKSIFVLHACAHNPTGVDPSKEQWMAIAETMREKEHIVFFDSAYQGYASGSLANDAFSVRMFATLGFECLVAQSFSKNLGLYCERTGALSFTLNLDTSSGKSEDEIAAESQHLKSLIRGTLELTVRANYSSPPAHGARVAHMVMTDPCLRVEWEEELRHMSARIQRMRQLVYDELVRLETPGSWKHILEQVGMFSYLGLSKEQCDVVLKHRVFILPSGRANMAGVTEESAILLAKSIDDAVRSVPSS